MIFIILFIFVRTWILRGLMSDVYTRRQIRRIHPGRFLCLHTHFQCSFYCWCYVFLLLRNTRWSFGCISAPSFPSLQRPLLPALTNAFTRCGVGALNRLGVFLLPTEIHDSRQSRRVVTSEFSPCPSQSFSPHKASFKLNPLQNCCFRCSFQFVNLLLLCLQYELNPFSLTRGLRTPNWSTLIINWQNDN